MYFGLFPFFQGVFGGSPYSNAHGSKNTGKTWVDAPRTEETEFCALPRRAASQEVEWSGGVGRGIRLKYKFEIVLVFGASQLPKSQASLTDAHLKPWQGF